MGNRALSRFNRALSHFNRALSHFNRALSRTAINALALTRLAFPANPKKKLREMLP